MLAPAASAARGECTTSTLAACTRADGWQHGVFAVPAVPCSAYPVTAALMQQPCASPVGATETA